MKKLQPKIKPTWVGSVVVFSVVVGWAPAVIAEDRPALAFDPGDRQSVERALQRLTPPGEAELLMLIEGLSANEFAARQKALRDLAAVAPSVRKFLENHRAATDDPEVRNGLSRVLEKTRAVDVGLERVATAIIDHGHRGLAAELVHAGADYHSTLTAEDLVVAAARLSADEADREALIKQLDRNSSSRRNAARVILGLGGDVRNELRPLLNDTGTTARLAAAEAFAAQSDAACLPALSTVAGDWDLNLRWRACDMIRQITGGEITVDPLTKQPGERIDLGDFKAVEAWAPPNPPEPIVLLHDDGLDAWMRSTEHFVDEVIVEQQDGFVRLAGSGNCVFSHPLRFTNYRLRLEWRFPSGQQFCESGLSLGKFDDGPPRSARAWDGQGVIEVEIKAGATGTLHPHGSPLSVGGKPFGGNMISPSLQIHEDLSEWNVLEVEERDGRLRVFANGLLVTEASGCSLEPTTFGLRCEGHPIDFRKMTLTPLPNGIVQSARPPAPNQKPETDDGS